MNKEVAKKAVQSAEQELEDKQVEKLKDVVKDILQKIRDLDVEIKKLEDDRKILKLDLENLKNGRLDLIEERQKVDKKAKEISVILVEKQVPHHFNDPWYQPYVIHYVPYYPPVQTFPLNPIYSTSGGQVGGFTTTSVFSLNNSTAKNFTSGTYAIGDNIVNLT